MEATRRTLAGVVAGVLLRGSLAWSLGGLCIGIGAVPVAFRGRGRCAVGIVVGEGGLVVALARDPLVDEPRSIVEEGLSSIFGRELTGETPVLLLQGCKTVDLDLVTWLAREYTLLKVTSQYRRSKEQHRWTQS